ncbi:Ldh family oxidoreductase [Paraburkholderia largidicola]|uniref:Malate dehydrogenase n=1 Tax=Paraburkholderia largidicola TaxID=3014751 RepID=A0A7I8C581_9BURK|nr:Ldh family oxidoreductase [Paraburkholderia sp. PGU16]BCF95050.1 malate dehydrogenase [Paraburkholderia sp. PGU16]
MTHNKSSLATPAELHTFVGAALRAADLPAGDAEAIASLMVQADMQGSDGHGVIRLSQYVKRIEAGGINRVPKIRMVSDRPAMAVIDGDNGMGHLVVTAATKLAIEKARETGVAWVGTRNSNHAGPASLYARMAVEQKMIALYFAVGNANHMPPWGGTDLLLSTNPIAVAIPTKDEVDVVLDMASTATAYGKVKAKAKRGELMPEGWMMDRSGRPLVDPTKSDEGFLLPIGGHKGYGLALVIGILAGTLNGAAMGKQVVDFNKDSSTRTNTGQSIVVLDVNAFADLEDFTRAIDTLIGDLRNSAKLPGVDRIWMPGEQSAIKRERFRAGGIPISNGVLRDLDLLADQLSIGRLKTFSTATTGVL